MTSDESIDLLEQLIGVPPDSNDVRFGSASMVVAESLEEEERRHLVLRSLSDDARGEGGSSDESGGLRSRKDEGQQGVES